MRVLIVGANGQLGRDVTAELRSRDIDIITSDIVGECDFLLDFTDKKKTLELVNQVEPDAIINCAAWAKVDDAEDEENKPIVYKLNVTGVENLVEAAKNVDAKLMHISTDYVFNGEGTTPWKPDDKCFGPEGYYGETKLLGEKAAEKYIDKAFIVRIAWLFGGPVSFVNTMIKVGRNHDEVRVVNDQIGTPTYSKDLARLLVDMIQTDKYGYYHATNEGGYISWYDFCKEIYKQADMNVKVNPVSTAEYGLSKAKRPLNSRLDKSKLVEQGFKPLPDWKDALSRYLKEQKYV